MCVSIDLIVLFPPYNLHPTMSMSNIMQYYAMPPSRLGDLEETKWLITFRYDTSWQESSIQNDFNYIDCREERLCLLAWVASAFHRACNVMVSNIVKISRMRLHCVVSSVDSILYIRSRAVGDQVEIAVIWTACYVYNLMIRIHRVYLIAFIAHLRMCLI